MADKWISVEDRLPEESGRYLGYLKELKDLGNSFSIINVAFNTNHKDSTAWTEQGEVLQYITHWMPLPNKPLNKQEQIIDANIAGQMFIGACPSHYKNDAEDYYKGTFNKD